MKFIKANWINHIDEFPIMMGIGNPPYQIRIEAIEDFLLKIMEHLDDDIYVSVHSPEKRLVNRFSTLYFDLDNKDLSVALKDGRRFAKWLKEKGFHYRVYFSGSKGFAFYVDFRETEIKDYRDRMDAFLDMLVKDLKITSFDRGVCCDANRISRLPYTVNTKSGKLCVPIDDIQTFEYEHLLSKPNKRILIKRRSSSIIEGFMRITYKKKYQDNTPLSKSDVQTQVNYILSHASQITDGVLNLIWTIIIPSLAIMQYTDDAIISNLRRYLKDNDHYTHKNIAYCNQQLRSFRNRSKKKFIYPMRLDTFTGRFDLGGI
ncbi:hypothetical protein LCGC14_0742230 [marine sediment metagenome]|uniref:Primase C-terminal 1 domain-containing protein n=1 Tax=marine sediment metagenome TaxID=412755 RepID=A0A0F9Q6A8_9ZZZZ